MRAPTRFLRRLGLLTGAVLSVLTAAAAASAAPRVDGHGRLHVLRIDGRDPSVIHVQRRAAGTRTEVRAEVPLQRVIAVDIDGDRRLEILARDEHSRLHVWKLDRRGGGYKPYRPWRSGPRRAPPPTSPGALGGEPPEDDGVLRADAQPPTPIDAVDASIVHPARHRAPAPPPALWPRPVALAVPAAPRPPPATLA